MRITLQLIAEGFYRIPEEAIPALANWYLRNGTLPVGSQADSTDSSSRLNRYTLSEEEVSITDPLIRVSTRGIVESPVPLFRTPEVFISIARLSGGSLALRYDAAQAHLWPQFQVPPCVLFTNVTIGRLLTELQAYRPFVGTITKDGIPVGTALPPRTLPPGFGYSTIRFNAETWYGIVPLGTVDQAVPHAPTFDPTLLPLEAGWTVRSVQREPGGRLFCSHINIVDIDRAERHFSFARLLRGHPNPSEVDIAFLESEQGVEEAAVDTLIRVGDIHLDRLNIGPHGLIWPEMSDRTPAWASPAPDPAVWEAVIPRAGQVIRCALPNVMSTHPLREQDDFDGDRVSRPTFRGRRAVIVRSEDLATALTPFRQAKRHCGGRELEQFTAIVRNLDGRTATERGITYVLSRDLQALPLRTQEDRTNERIANQALQQRYRAIYGQDPVGRVSEGMLALAEDLHLRLNQGELVGAEPLPGWVLNLDRLMPGLGAAAVTELATKDPFNGNRFLPATITEDDLVCHPRRRMILARYVRDLEGGITVLAEAMASPLFVRIAAGGLG